MKKLLVISFLVLSSSLFTLCQAQFTVLSAFDNTVIPIGGEPYGSLTASVTGDTLYGMLYVGGKFGYGDIFYITANGSAIDTLYSFSGGNDGGYPEGALTLVGRKLYGTTNSNGLFSNGDLFSVNTDGSGFDTLHSFGAAIDVKSTPYAGWYLTPSVTGDTLYGITQEGGVQQKGSIFSYSISGSNYDTVYSFTGAMGNCTRPVAGVTLSVTGDTLFGMTNHGGPVPNNQGSVYCINKDGSGFDTLHTFSSSLDYDKGAPEGSVTLVGNQLYGLTFSGGSKQHGFIFHINVNGTGYDTLHCFGAGITNDGDHPEQSLTLSSSGKLYGMTTDAGAFGNGIIFSIDSKTGEYDTLHSFTVNDGQYPVFSNLTLLGDTIFGMTNEGGANGAGTIFRFLPPVFYKENFTNEICNGASTGSATVTDISGGYKPYTYSWSPAGGSSIMATGLSAATYTITVTDNKGSSLTASVIITEPTALSVTTGSTDDNGSGNGTATVTPSGGTQPYTYAWNDGSSQNTATATGLIAGSYTCTVTEASGCGSTATLVTVNSSTGIQSINNSSAISIYPNPSTGIVNMQLSGISGQSSVVEVYNMLGEKVTQFTIYNSQFTINLSTQPNGVYLYRVLTETGNLVGGGRLVIQK